MFNRINLNGFNIHTDIILDDIDNIFDFNKDNIVKYMENNISVSKVKIDKNYSKLLNKNIGNYITIEFSDITNYEDRECIGRMLEKELKELLVKLDIKDSDSCLVVGLGNDCSTPDSLGPKVIDKLVVTRHLFLLKNNFVNEGIRNVSAVSPGVMSDTGIETSDIILDLVKDIKPKFLIVIDALASSSIDRINRTIQITDTGIHPGSGIGNDRKEISYKNIGIPVIAIGVPTVVGTTTLIVDTIEYLFKHISYIKNNYNKNKLVYNYNNYLDKIKDKKLSNIEKKEVLGMIGELNEVELKQLFDEVLNSIGYNMIVTPTEIDFLINKLSEVIGNALNNSLHKSINNF